MIIPVLLASQAGLCHRFRIKRLETMNANLSTLRHTIARMENRPAAFLNPDRNLGQDPVEDPRAESACGPQEGFLKKNKTETNSFVSLATGVETIDGLFANHGLAGNALHEIHAPEARAAGAATGFLTGLLVRLAQTEPGQVPSSRTPSTGAQANRLGIGSCKPILWVQDPASAREAGRLHAPGLYAFGLDPRRVITLAARSMSETLWALEEGLSCQGLGAVVGDVRGQSRALDLTATRRLALRAAKAQTPVLFLKTSIPEDASAARSRWRVAPAASAPLGQYHNGLGHPAWRLELSKNRDGPTGTWTLEWNPHDQSFSLVATEPGLAADSRPLAAAPADRPARPHPMGTVVALRHVG